MKKLILILAVLSALTIPSMADFASDFKAARAIQMSNRPEVEKQTEARAAFQAIAARETGVNKDLALVYASISLVRSGKVDEGLDELSKMTSVVSKVAWVDISLRVKKQPTSAVERVANEVLGTSDGQNVRYYLVKAYISEKQWAKVKANTVVMAGENPVLVGLVLSDITKNSTSIFSSKEEQLEFYNNLLRVIPAVESNAQVLGLLKSQVELLK